VPLPLVIDRGPDGLDSAADGIGDGLASRRGLVLVDQRGVHAVMAHADHQVTQACTAGRSEDVAGMTKIMEGQAGAQRRRSLP